MRGHRDDVDDRAALAAAAHVLDRRLHEEERAAGVDRDVLVEEFGRRVQQAAAGGEAGAVHQPVDAAEPFARPLDRRPALRRVAHVAGDELGLRAVRPELRGHLLAGLAAAAGDHHGGAVARRGDGGAQTLGAAADQDDLALEQSVVEFVHRSAHLRVAPRR